MTPVDPLLSIEGCQWLLDGLLEAPPEEIDKRCNIQLLNLLCACRLPGNENLNIRACLNRLDRLTEYVRIGIARTFSRFGPSDQYSGCKYQTWMACLITLMKREFGVRYSPTAKADLDAGINAPFSDASEVFINGMLIDDREHRWGTCASIPVLITAIARKLGYPVRLAHAKGHRYCRWEGEGTCFNIEASNPMGMSVEPDEHFHEIRGGIPPEMLKAGYYFRSVTPAEEFASFMIDRAMILHDAARYHETFLWSARALQFSPELPKYPETAYYMADLALKQRYRVKHPDAKIGTDEDFFYEVADLVLPQERACFLTIVGHYRESRLELDAARTAYENACRQNFEGNNEQRDLQRFLKKYDLPTQSGPLLPPNCVGEWRRFQLKCRPEDAPETLRRMADDFEKNSKPLMARDALHDLYILNPCDAEVFQRTRALERQPLFQAQLGALIRQRRQMFIKAGVLPPLKSNAPATAKFVPSPFECVSTNSGTFVNN